MRKILIAPSLLSSDFANLAAELERLAAAGLDMLHIDIMDGHFVPNITVGSAIVAALRPLTSLPLDCHLMISEPDRYIADFVKAGADMISIHSEAVVHPHRTLSMIRNLGVKAGLALNPLTPLSYAFAAAEYLDYIVLMSVNPGFGGQSFIPNFVPRCQTLREHLDSSAATCGVSIEVDGGINSGNLGLVIGAGADIIVSGSGLFGGPGGLITNAERFKKIIQTTKET